uniref:Uncharacterized protein n=1 Tax=Arundo donax TaxID=35708 RepID=A0A0A9GFP6_ARUDO
MASATLMKTPRLPRRSRAMRRRSRRRRVRNRRWRATATATMSGSESWSVCLPTCPSGSCSGLAPTGRSPRGLPPPPPPPQRRRLAGLARRGRWR